MFSVVVLSLLVSVVVGDLPIHCTTSHVAGKWSFSVGPQTHDHTYTCGYSAPDKNEFHFRPPQSNYRFKETQSVEFELATPNIVKDGSGKEVGTWTMIYDEGFEVRANGLVYFAFNKYHPKPGSSTTSDEVKDYISECGATMIGWFHGWDGADRDKWGCWQGVKKTDEYADAASVSQSQGQSLLEANPDSVSHHAVQHHKRRPTPVRQHTPVVVSKKEYTDNPDAMFVPSTEFVETVNGDTSSTWQAKIHDHFKHYTVRDLMRMIGWRQYHKPTSAPLSIPSAGRAHTRRPLAQIDVSELPESFDWRSVEGRNFVTPVRNQESCGSCYSIAATAVAESRLLIKDHSLDVATFSLSPQSVVSCSTYNQGCDGGYPYLVAKHGHDFGLVEEHCMPYSGTDSMCSAECGDKQRYFIDTYGYVGGFYGGCTEEAMMQEIHDNGPIIVAFNAPGALFYYNGGIFSCNTVVTESEPQASGCADVHKWEKTNHAVVAVGWGVDNGRKYWIIKNSWGPSWGESGYFRIVRGEDACAVESMGVHLEPIAQRQQIHGEPNPAPASSLAECSGSPSP